MTAEEKKKIVETSFDHMLVTLKHTKLPINAGDTTIGETRLREGDVFKLTTALINEGFLLERHGVWCYDEYADQPICSMCCAKALTDPNEPDKFLYTDCCYNCGASMNNKEY